MASSKPDELFYCENHNIQLEHNLAILKGQEATHCSKVLRYKEGEEIYFTNAESDLFKGQIIRIKKGEVDIQITSSRQVIDTKEPFYPILCMGVLKNKERMEWLIEKSIEIGVSKINFVQFTRSERSNLNLDRLKTIALSAMKQSQRLVIPEIAYYNSINDCFNSFKHGLYSHFVAHEKISNNESNNYRDPLIDKKKVFWIGPEGGFTEDEISLIKEKTNANPISLGAYRLRAETAALLVVSNCNY